MDPKQHQLSKLDPKLKEAYERVMSGLPTSETPPPVDGSAIPIKELTPNTAETAKINTTETSIAADLSPKPNENPASSVISPTTQSVVQEQQVVSTTPVIENITKTPLSTPVGKAAPQKVHLGYQSKPHEKIVSQKKKASIPSFVYIMGGIIFFLLYTLFWIKVFNIPLPFLP